MVQVSYAVELGQKISLPDIPDCITTLDVTAKCGSRGYLSSEEQGEDAGIWSSNFKLGSVGS